MDKNQIFTILIISLFIFTIGFVIRAESVNLPIIKENKEFYLDSHDLPYMYELDSYYHYRLTKNFIEHGYMGDEKIDGLEWDSYSYYPSGVHMDYPPLIIYITAFIYLFLNYFSSIDLIEVGFWLPAFLAPLAGIVAFLIVRKYTNDYGGLVAGILAVTAPTYYFRTLPGFFDTDMFNVLFPLLIVWMLMESINSDNINKKIILSFTAGLTMFIFSIAWNGWQYLFFLLIIFCIIFLIYSIIKYRIKKKKTDQKVFNIKKNPILVPVILFSLTTIFLILIFSGYLNIYKLIMGPFELLKMSSGNLWYPWPDIYIYVSELQIPTLNMIISGVGPIVLMLGLMGIILILRILRNEKMKESYLNNFSKYFFIFIVIWTIAGFLSLLKGFRFVLMLVPPLVISAGLFVGISIGYLDALNWKKSSKRLMAILFVFLIIIPPLMNVNDSMNTLVPGINDDLWDASQWMKSNTSNNTVIISSWSYGHLFTGIAERPVVMDGRLAYIETLPIRNFDKSYIFGVKSPSSARAYWINKAFATNNESLSIGIFRMISNSGDVALLKVENITKDSKLSIRTLNDILGISKDDAKKVLIKKYSFTNSEADEILNFTHPPEKNPYVIVTTDSMVRIGEMVFEEGLWDFERDNVQNFTYSTFYIDNNTFNSSKNLTINQSSGVVKYKNQDPYCVITIENNTTKKRIINPKSNLCIILDLNENLVVVMNKEFERSVFARLIIFKQPNKYFKPLYKNNSVIIWKTDFN